MAAHTHTLNADGWVFIFGCVFSAYAQALLHAHTYIKNICIHTQTHTHIYLQRPSLCWVGKESGVTGCCQPVRERREEGKGEEEEQPWLWRNLQNGAPPPHHSIKTNAIRAGPYLSRLMLADRVAAIWNAHAIMHFPVPLTDWWCIISRLDGSCRNR